MHTVVLVFMTGPACEIFSAPTDIDLASVMAFGSFMSQRELPPCTPLTHPELGRVSQDVLPASYSQSYSTIP